MLTGCLVPIVTPMTPDGVLDLATLRNLIDWYIANDAAGIVVVGTTGESPTVDFEEHHALIKATVDHVAGRAHVMAGTGSNSTAEAIDLAAYAKKVGADSCLSVVPYYNKPSQEGLYRHFRTIAEEVDLPLVLYNVPGRTVADLANDTVLRLSQVPGIVGLKDATGDIGRATELIKALNEAGKKDFALYSGDDITSLAFLLLGGHGVISVTACVAPQQIAAMCRAAARGDIAKARALNDTLLPLHRKLFVEGNPVPVKWAMAQMGLISAGIRLPLAPLSESFHEPLRQALRAAGCLA
ncbi:MAG: 4-hydroxy-tetrahydrodipicolinate synthase [Proteobacteria bacterium]|nr:4-hydroxy-tetrahydrodipicolinate synthase [Pseudomonadota bacterium]MCL2307974.1 4-hydroxy-tetrahydrodipicolinate synthase [Pseudomonadota bacterium]